VRAGQLSLGETLDLARFPDRVDRQGAIVGGGAAVETCGGVHARQRPQGDGEVTPRHR